MEESRRIQIFWVVGIVLGLLGTIFHLNVVPHAWKKATQPKPPEIWSYIKKESDRKGLNPNFVYSIAFAESTLNPYADTGYARGLMQMSEVAWITVDKSSYNNAFDWKDNVNAGTAYLDHLKDELSKSGNFSYPLLAASYRYGINKVRRANYEISELPRPKNKIYQELFTGMLAPVDPPVS
ncbi:transglycosylase SLT domain-containing protein [Rubellicoccus peritrichatus]|uniref:Transglycosylase SLT domain-containing protein n=1 Tax=Rubellicoccus peritrichatus TaxID=3080537 RepID=A0AAQ3QUA0_9BACT|nr:transglycosylase SLT domain-containing protein [Puniceicoccus sp. CR14]WOO39765.1 transglycosylase SLT domain-containing protein [Puniceicoccus sp. CR14]